jgi:glycosyltransferase involved in cell wall biosynthesis/SAM-dependent methyltransferase
MTHVLVVSHDPVGRQMAGPGIRYRELTRVLAQYFEVTLAVPCEPDMGNQPFEVWPYERDRWDSLAGAAGRADVIVACGDTLADFPAVTQLSIPLVIDGYDPHTLETLALWAGEPIDVQTARHDQRLAVLRCQCQVGDFFICASERQRDWWLGQLEQQGRINPLTFARDPSLRRLIDVVPYGLPSEPPRATGPVLRGVWPGIDAGDQILLWGGGLWQWLDPLTALRAVRRLVDGGMERVRLVFPGTRHPNPDMPDMPMRAQALALADELGLTGRYAFFGDWVPHEDWPSVLLEADLGLSLHPDTVETRLAFRSRVLDYIWAGLPMVVTQGDATSEAVGDHGLGIVVKYGDDAVVARAIQDIMQQPRSAWQDRFARAQAEMTWEHAAWPLVAFCQDPYRAADRQSDRPLPQEHLGQNPTQVIAEREREIARLQGLLSGFDREPLIRLARHVQKGWQSVLGSRLILPWLDALRTERFYRQLTHEVGRASSHAFVDQAYWHILGRAPDPDGFDHFTGMLAQGQCSRREVVAGLVRSVEFHLRPRPELGLVETLHSVRCQLVRRLPQADHILDLGGAAPNSIQGALLVMGYPYPVCSLTIVDLPPADRLGRYACGSKEGEGGWIDTEMGPLRYLHTSMTDLSDIEDGSMDLVLAGQSIEHVSEKDGRQTMQEVLRVLRPGGMFCLDTPNAALTRIQLRGSFMHPEHRVEYEVSGLVARLQAAGFTIKDVRGICPMPRTVQTGIFHEQELLDNAVLADQAEICYLFVVECVKPGGG